MFAGIVGAEPFRDIATWSAAELAEREAAVQRARSTIGEERFGAAEARGLAMSYDEAIDSSLGLLDRMIAEAEHG